MWEYIIIYVSPLATRCLPFKVIDVSINDSIKPADLSSINNAAHYLINVTTKNRAKQAEAYWLGCNRSVKFEFVD